MTCTNNKACNFNNIRKCTESLLDDGQYDVTCICTDEYQGNTCDEKDPCFLDSGKHLCRKLDLLATCDSTNINELRCECSNTTLYTGDYCQYTVNGYTMASKLINSSSGMDILESSMDQSHIMDDTFAYFLAETNATDEELSKLSWDLSEILIDAKFDQRPFNAKDDLVKTFDPALGNCYTFNHYTKRNSLRTFYMGLEYGLNMVFQLNSIDMLPWIRSANLKIFIHSTKETFTKGSINYKATATAKNVFLILFGENIKLPQPYSSCLKNGNKHKSNFYFNGSFSEAGCYISCYMDYINKKCNCQDPMYGINKILNKKCLLKDRNCVENILEKKRDPVYWPECKCSKPCYYMDYEVSYNMASFLKWMPECTSINPKNMHPQTYLQSVNCQKIWNDRVWIQVTLADTVRKYTSEKAKKSISDLFTMLGALTGSLVGISAVTVFELIILCLRLLRIL